MRAIYRAGLCLAALAIPAAIAVAQGDAPPAKAARWSPVQTKAEAEARAMAMFDRIDTNKDGYVTRPEADAAKARMHARMAERMKGWRDARFARMDANKDGSISRAEFDASGAGQMRTGPMRMAMRDAPPPPVPPVPPVPPRAGVAPPPPPAPPPPRRMAGMGHGMMAGKMFDHIDADHDGRVSRAEAKTAADTRFAMRDRDGDGRIGPDEMRGRRFHPMAEGKMPG